MPKNDVLVQIYNLLKVMIYFIKKLLKKKGFFHGSIWKSKQCGKLVTWGTNIDNINKKNIYTDQKYINKKKILIPKRQLLRRLFHLKYES